MKSCQVRLQNFLQSGMSFILIMFPKLLMENGFNRPTYQEVQQAQSY